MAPSRRRFGATPLLMGSRFGAARIGPVWNSSVAARMRVRLRTADDSHRRQRSGDESAPGQAPPSAAEPSPAVSPVHSHRDVRFSLAKLAPQPLRTIFSIQDLHISMRSRACNVTANHNREPQEHALDPFRRQANRGDGRDFTRREALPVSKPEDRAISYPDLCPP